MTGERGAIFDFDPTVPKQESQGLDLDSAAISRAENEGMVFRGNVKKPVGLDFDRAALIRAEGEGMVSKAGLLSTAETHQFVETVRGRVRRAQIERERQRMRDSFSAVSMVGHSDVHGFRHDF